MNTPKNIAVNLFAGILLGAVLVLVVILVYVGQRNAGIQGPGYEAKTDAGAEETETSSVSPETEETETSETETEEEEDYTLLVAVPADYMNIREKPGTDSEDVIGKIEPGTFLKWYGDTETEGENEFYYVKVRGEELEGYVNADYCVGCETRPDLSALDIVEVGDSPYTYDQMVQDIDGLCKAYPGIIESRVIGQSMDGRDIYEVTLGSKDAENHILAQATIHAREYVNSLLVMKLLEYYAHYYDEGSVDGTPFREIFSTTCVHVVPMVNPDGVVISSEGVDHLKDSRYRDLVRDCYERDKNDLIYEINVRGDWTWSDKYKDETFVRGDEDFISFEDYQKIWKANANGVDLNKNYDAAWEELKCRYIESYSDYRGNAIGSEPETKALLSLAQEREYKAFLSYHSMGQIIYYDAEGTSKPTSEASAHLADRFSEWLKYDTYNNRDAVNTSLAGFGDWTQRDLNTASITIESGLHPCPLQPSEFPGIFYRHLETWARLSLELSE